MRRGEGVTHLKEALAVRRRGDRRPSDFELAFARSSRFCSASMAASSAAFLAPQLLDLAKRVRAPPPPAADLAVPNVE